MSQRPGSAPDPDGLSAEDRALLGRVADRVVALHLEVPAVLALETGRPLSVLAGQTLHFFEPLVQAILPLPNYRRFARLIERREVVEQLVEMIETHADAARTARRRRPGAGGVDPKR